MKGKIKPDLKFDFNFGDEIPDLNIEVPLKKKEVNKTNIEIYKKEKDGRKNSGLF